MLARGNEARGSPWWGTWEADAGLVLQHPWRGKYGRVPYYCYHSIIPELAGRTCYMIRGKCLLFPIHGTRPYIKPILRTSRSSSPQQKQLFCSRRESDGDWPDRWRLTAMCPAVPFFPFPLPFPSISPLFLCTYSQPHHDPPTTCLL